MAKDKNTGRGSSRENPNRMHDDIYGNSGYGNNGYMNNGYNQNGGYNQNTGYNNMQFSRIPVRGEVQQKEQIKTESSKKEKKSVKSERVALPEKGKRTRKQKKLAKKIDKFDEMDLRNYPMTVGSWIGTFILLAIPLINGICAICWFFGVGNKSRSAWVRSYVVIALLIVLILGIILGVGWTLLSKSAKDNGASSPNEVLFYGASKAIDFVCETIGKAEMAEDLKVTVAGILKVEYTPANGGTNGGDENSGGNGSAEGGEYEDYPGYEEDLGEAVA